MRRSFILIVLCFTSSGGVWAQELSKGYMDSVKGFFRDLINSQPEINEKKILDNAIFLNSKLDSDILNVEYHRKDYFHQFISPNFNSNYHIKIYKIDKESQKGDTYPFYKKLDSLYFSKNEINQILTEMIHKRVTKWSPDIISAGKIVTQKQIDSTRVSLEFVLSNQFKKVTDSNANFIPNSPFAEDYEKARHNHFYGTMYWKYCNPVFIKKGKYAVMYYYQFNAPMFASVRLSVYKNESGHWHYFGDIFDIHIN